VEVPEEEEVVVVDSTTITTTIRVNLTKTPGIQAILEEISHKAVGVTKQALQITEATKPAPQPSRLTTATITIISTKIHGIKEAA
jgi:hypothetical protein